MQVTNYLQLFETKRLTEDQIHDLHYALMAISGKCMYSIGISDSDEMWVVKGEENDFHLWEIQYHFQSRGEDLYMSHAIVLSRAVEYSAHDILDKLNVALKAKHPN